MKKTTIGALLLGIALSSHAQNPVSLSAGPGRTEMIISSHEVSSGQHTVAIRFKQLLFDKKWAPSATFGFSVGESRDNSIQFFVFQSRKESDFLTAGYRIFRNAEVVKQVFFKDHLEIKATANFQVEIVNGEFILSINGLKRDRIPTRMRSVRSYIAVASGEAEFIGFDLTSQSNSDALRRAADFRR